MTEMSNARLNQNELLVEVLGVDRPNREYLLSLKQIIEKRVQQQTMRIIAENFVKSTFKLQKADIEFLQKSPQKRLFMFPVSNAITDKLALLIHLKTSLSRKFLQKIELDKKQNHLKVESTLKSLRAGSVASQCSSTMAHVSSDDDGGGGDLATPSTHKNQAMKQSSRRVFDMDECFRVSYDETEESLFFNYRVSYEKSEVSDKFDRYKTMQMKADKGQLGEFFGNSLALLSFGFVEELTEQDLDSLICSAPSEAEAINKLKEVSVKSLDVHVRHADRKETSIL